MPLAGGDGTSSGIKKPRKPRRPRTTSLAPTPAKVTKGITPTPIIGPSAPNYNPSANLDTSRVRQAPPLYGPSAPVTPRNDSLQGIASFSGPPVGTTDRTDAALRLVESMQRQQMMPGGVNPVMSNEPRVEGRSPSYSNYAAGLGHGAYSGYADSLEATGGYEDRLNPINSDSPINPDREPSQVLTPKEIARKLSRRGGFGLYNVASPIEGFDFDADTNTFGPRIHPVHGRRSMHTGEDMSVGMGTPVQAPVGGVIKSVSPNAGAYGMQIVIDHGNGEETMYGHLSDMSVAVGQKVKKGDVIGAVGSTGLSTGPHLHWETWKDGEALDPNTVFNRPLSPEVTEAARKKFGGVSQSRQPAQTPAPQPNNNELAPNDGLNALMQAIREQESGGDYRVQNGIGAMGAYQIMPSNIEGPAGWDMEALGRNITGQEFLSNPTLQNNIARFKLRDYFKKYGAGGAAKAWYAGPGNADLNSDGPQYGGPSVNDYSASVLELMRKYLGQ